MCGFCHGRDALGGETGPDLTRSALVASDVRGNKLGPMIRSGRPEKGMPPFSASQMVTQNWEGLYAYLKGRSDGQIKPGHLYPIETK